MMQPVYISTTYLGPVQQYCKLFQYPEVHLETAENYLKQTFRNRCTIAAANGPLALSIPIVKPDTLKCPTKDIRISDHGNWRHLHWNALVSAYNMSPFFEYYEEDFAPFYEKKYEFLFDYNEELRQLICRLLDLHPNVIYTEEYQSEEMCIRDSRRYAMCWNGWMISCLHWLPSISSISLFSRITRFPVPRWRSPC